MVRVHRLLVVFACLAAAPRSGSVAARVESLSRPSCSSGPHDLASTQAWIETAPDAGRSADGRLTTSRHCANFYGCSYVVAREGTSTLASDLYREPSAPAFPPGFDKLDFRGEIAGDGDFFVQRTPDGGWLVAHNAGEFGATVRWYRPDGRESYEVSRENVIGFSETPAGILAPAGLDHLGEGRGGVLIFEPTGRRAQPWRARWVGRFPSAAYASAKDSAGSLWVASSHALIEVTARGALRILHASDWQYLYPTSMVVAADGTIFVGMRGAVAKLTRGADGWHERWLVPRECPRLDGSNPDDENSCRCGPVR